ncbi:MAG TPA: hypothetical protein VFN48_07990, partial [Solirubrobacteraceae bacterium]|nr:hypothetical protein [Solirubrobacteraceae bacterium]
MGAGAVHRRGPALRRLAPARPWRAWRAPTWVLGVFAAGIALRVVFTILYRPGFLGITDTGSYLAAARGQLFSNIYDPAGYPL